MRLQLICICTFLSTIGVVGSQGTLRASDERQASASVRVYADDDHVTVVSPAATAQVPLDRAVTVDVGTTVDVVTAASVDVVTQASPGTVHELRVEGRVGGRWELLNRHALATRAIVSQENDYRSLHWMLGWRTELAQRNTTLDLRYTAGIDQVGRSNDPTFSRFKGLQQITFTASQILGTHTLADLVLDGQTTFGYHANPYRAVPIIDPASTFLYRVPETTPERRVAGAALLRLRQALGDRPRWFLQADYRFYGDSWEVTSHTVSFQPVFSPTGSIRIGALLRAYTQAAASFYQPNYFDANGPPALRTRDRTLGGMHSWYGLGTLDVRIVDDLQLLVSAGWARFYFHNFPPQSERTALIGSIGASATF